ncbi:MAG: anaerobic ribonucleoside-triphosphate reductase [Treponemataceae bacterium]
MRTLEEIEKELTAAKVELGKAEGTPTEVYSRIVGYYRSVRNWNRGKREEYAERKLYDVRCGVPENRKFAKPVDEQTAALAVEANVDGEKVLLFVRAACPACPPAKDAAAKLSVAVELVDADTVAGLERAELLQVFSTPTAILLDAEGKEIKRARDALGIASFTAGKELANVASL